MKIERIDRWVKEGKIERRVRAYKVNGTEYKLLREAKAALAGAAAPKGYLVTACHPETIRVQAFEYRTIRQAQADAKKHGWVIQSVQKIA